MSWLESLSKNITFYWSQSHFKFKGRELQKDMNSGRYSSLRGQTSTRLAPCLFIVSLKLAFLMLIKLSTLFSSKPYSCLSFIPHHYFSKINLYFCFQQGNTSHLLLNPLQSGFRSHHTIKN